MFNGGYCCAVKHDIWFMFFYPLDRVQKPYGDRICFKFAEYFVGASSSLQMCVSINT